MIFKEYRNTQLATAQLLPYALSTVGDCAQPKPAKHFEFHITLARDNSRPQYPSPLTPIGLSRLYGPNQS